MLTQVSTGGETGSGIIDAGEDFERKRTDDLAEENRARIYNFASDICVGVRNSGESIELDLAPPQWVNKDRQITDREAYETTVEGALQQLRDYFRADNKLGKPEENDETSVWWSADIYEAGQPFKLTVKESRDDSDPSKLPISAVAYVSKPRSRFNVIKSERPHPKDSLAKRIFRLLSRQGK